MGTQKGDPIRVPGGMLRGILRKVPGEVCLGETLRRVWGEVCLLGETGSKLFNRGALIRNILGILRLTSPPVHANGLPRGNWQVDLSISSPRSRGDTEAKGLLIPMMSTAYRSVDGLDRSRDVCYAGLRGFVCGGAAHSPRSSTHQAAFTKQQHSPEAKAPSSTHQRSSNDGRTQNDNQHDHR